MHKASYLYPDKEGVRTSSQQPDKATPTQPDLGLPSSEVQLTRHTRNRTEAPDKTH